MTWTVEDDRDFYRSEYIRWKFFLDHVLANDGLHDPGICRTCDLIRVRPTRAFTSVEEAEEHFKATAAPQ